MLFPIILLAKSHAWHLHSAAWGSPMLTENTGIWPWGSQLHSMCTCNCTFDQNCCYLSLHNCQLKILGVRQMTCGLSLTQRKFNNWSYTFLLWFFWSCSSCRKAWDSCTNAPIKPAGDINSTSQYRCRTKNCSMWCWDIRPSRDTR